MASNKTKDAAAVSLGKRGGKVRSAVKTATARANGSKGGRPRKTPKDVGVAIRDEGVRAPLEISAEVRARWEADLATGLVYESADGEMVEVKDHDRWLEQAEEALRCLDENFNHGDGALDTEDEPDQWCDLLCCLMHLAQERKVDFALAFARAQGHYNVERKR